MFDLGDPLHPPSPVKIAAKVDDKPTTEKVAPLAEIPIPQAKEEEGYPKPAAPASIVENAGEEKQAIDGGSGLVIEDFEDAVEPLQAESPAEVAGITAEGPAGPEAGKANLAAAGLEESNAHLPAASSGAPAESAPPAEPPQAAEKIKTGYITAGLSGVRLPTPRQRWNLDSGISVVEAEDTDGEGEFHDAYDTVAGLVKDAAKALEMKEAGNGCVN